MSSLIKRFNFLLVLLLLASIFSFGAYRPQDLTAILLLSVVMSAAYFDLTTRRIPNWLTYGAVFAALAWQAIAWFMAWSTAVSWQDSALGGMLCGGTMFGLWKMKAIGGGDVKLAISLGLLMGAFPAVSGILLAHLVAAGFVVAWLVARSLVASGTLAISSEWISRLQLNQPLGAGTRLPMAGFYAAGVCLVMWAI